MNKVICIFGDSIIWGRGLPSRVGWANLLRNYIENKSKFTIDLYDLGIDRDTTEDILKRFDAEAAARKPDMVIFAAGVNDSAYRMTKDYPLVSIDIFEKNLNALIKKARKFTEEIVFVGLSKGSDKETKPLAASTTGKCYDKENVKIYNGIIKKICDKEKVSFIDIIDLLLNNNPPEHITPYGFWNYRLLAR